ncbi:MAG: hypothetical protein CMN32_14630 [Saprospirales bacterium]|nr:hypothetical protein [Saprospirales bacterium]
MALCKRLLSFVPPTLLFVLPLFSQIQGQLELLSDNTYLVSAIPTVDWSPPMSVTNSAQITIRATSGKFVLTDFQSQLGVWTPANPIIAPSEAPQYDYYSFSLVSPVANVTYENGSPIPLFSFRNNGTCAELEIIDTATDPFMPPNSMNANIGNSFSIIGAGIGQNAYEGNAPESSVSCPALGLSVSDEGIDCYGETTTLNIAVLGGEAPYQIYWQHTGSGADGYASIADYGGSVSMSNMEGGQYYIEVHDNLDSTSTTNYQLSQPAPINITLLGYDASCNGSMDGVALVKNVSGGTIANDYQYYWNTNPTVSSPSIGFLDPGVYTVTVVDDNGCSAEESIELGEAVTIYPNPIVRDITCHGGADGIIDLYPVGFNPPFTYDWSSNVQTGPYSSAWQLPAGTYSVTVTDATGVCNTTVEFVLDDPPAIETDYQLSEAVCYGDKGYLTVLAVENAEEPWTISVTEGRELNPGFEYEVEPGVQQILTIEDAKGCIHEEEFLIPAPTPLYVEAGDNLLLKYGEQTQLTPQISPQTGVIIRWTPADDLSCDDCPDPVLYPTDSRTYRLTVTDSAGCSTTDAFSVFVRKSRDLYIPTAFSPNGDGINDIFIPYGGFEAIRITGFKVFDRWGGTLYELENPVAFGDDQSGWDGTVNGKPLTAGTYLYAINVEFIDGEEVLFAGEVTLMR